MSSTAEAPFLACGACDGRLTSDNQPMVSSTCGHSICKNCLIKKAGKSTNAAADHDPDQFSDCPICKTARAFHPKLSQVNVTALAAIDIMDQYAQMLQAKTAKILRRQVTSEDESSKEVAIVAKKDTAQPKATTDSQANTAKTVNIEPRGVSPTSTKTLHKAATRKESPAISTISSTTSEGDSDSDSSSLKPGGERMVWVKFDKSTQLAWLIGIKGNTAKVRWEACKYEEEVPLKRIEELDSDASGSRSKRSRRVTMSSQDIRHSSAGHANKTKKRRKNYM